MQCVDNRGKGFIGLIRARYVSIMRGKYCSLAISILPLPTVDYSFASTKHQKVGTASTTAERPRSASSTSTITSWGHTTESSNTPRGHLSEDDPLSQDLDTCDWLQSIMGDHGTSSSSSMMCNGLEDELGMPPSPMGVGGHSFNSGAQTTNYLTTSPFRAAAAASSSPATASGGASTTTTTSSSSTNRTSSGTTSTNSNSNERSRLKKPEDDGTTRPFKRIALSS